MGASSNTDSAPAFFDEFAISSASSTSNVDTSPTHVSSTNTSSNAETLPVQVSSHFANSSLHISSTHENNMSASPAAYFENVVSEQNVENVSTFENVSTLKSRIEELSRSRDDLERQLLVQAASVKQYDVYCQSLVRFKI